MTSMIRHCLIAITAILALTTSTLAADAPSNQGYHYNHNAETYYETGERLGRAMADLLGSKQ